MSATAQLEHPIPVFAIVGPTASGKTALAIELARELDAEIVGADSMQVYRHMDIGTDTPGEEELDGVRHHLIDVVNPDERYDAAAYSHDADAAIADIAARGKRVILVGGTGLYVRILLRGLQSGPPPDDAIRSRIGERAAAEGWPALHAKLRTVDPEAAERLHPNDGVRILRALEVHEQSGVPLTEWQRRHRFATVRYPFEMVAVSRDRDRLAERIERRVIRMMADGFLSEVERLLAMGYGPDLKPMQGLGYRRMCDHLAGEISLDEAVALTARDTRKLAKRQRTWFNGEHDLTWLEAGDGSVADRAARFFDGGRPR